MIDGDGLSLIDTLATPDLAAVADAEVADLTAELGLRLKRVILTSSRIPFTGGSAVFWRAGFYGSEAVSEQLDEPVNPDVLARLMPQHAAAFHREFETRPITHIISEMARLTEAALVHLLPGEGPMNTVVQVPAAEVVFLGALGSFGVTPLAFDGDPAVWADSLEAAASLGSMVVPGHGMPGGSREVEMQAAYLRACVAAEGNPAAIGPGPWDTWTDRRFDEVNVERAHRLGQGDRSTPDAMFRLLGMA
ncbi:MAG: hypothetical protein HKN03_09145 [Acidimicrobiales bacterium]|nr:hypothetical protein [Acidimicrobiales bacterium]